MFNDFDDSAVAAAHGSEDEAHESANEGPGDDEEASKFQKELRGRQMTDSNTDKKGAAAGVAVNDTKGSVAGS